MSFVDFHCHLDLYDNPADVLRACKESGVSLLAVTTLPSGARRVASLVERSAADVHVGIGLHPEHVHLHERSIDVLIEGICEWAFVGEVGLDGSEAYQAHQDVQQRVFSRVLTECERQGGRILSIHSRRAVRAVVNELASHPNAGIAVLHWFSGSQSELADCLMAGCWFSVGLPMMRSSAGRERISAMPRNRVLTETDGPLARVGQVQQHPTDLPKTVRALASIWQLSEDETRDIVWSNYVALLKAGGVQHQRIGSAFAYARSVQRRL